MTPENKCKLVDIINRDSTNILIPFTTECQYVETKLVKSNFTEFIENNNKKTIRKMNRKNKGLSNTYYY